MLAAQGSDVTGQRSQIAFQELLFAHGMTRRHDDGTQRSRPTGIMPGIGLTAGRYGPLLLLAAERSSIRSSSVQRPCAAPPAAAAWDSRQRSAPPPACPAPGPARSVLPRRPAS